MAITAHTQYHNKNIATSIKISIKQSHDYNKKQNDNNFCTWYKTIKKSESDTVYKFLSSICLWDDKKKSGSNALQASVAATGMGKYRVCIRVQAVYCEASC